MKTFNVLETEIIFSDEQEYQIAIYSQIYSNIYKLIHNNFEDHFFNFNINKYCEDNSFQDDEDIHMLYIEKMSDMFWDSCKEIKKIIREMFEELNITIDERMLDEEVKFCIESSFEDVYGICNLEGANLMERTIARNQEIRSNIKNKLLFIADLSNAVSYGILQAILKELYTSVNSCRIEAAPEGEELVEFNDSDVLSYIIQNSDVRKIREDIERKGIRGEFLSIYVNTLQRDPFNIRPYFNLLEYYGDFEYSLRELFLFVFSSEEILETYKLHLYKKSIEKEYGDTREKIVEKISHMNSDDVLTYITEMKKFYGISINTRDQLESDIENYLNDLDSKRRSVEGYEYDSIEDADVIRKELQLLNEKFEGKTLIEMQQSYDEIKNKVYDYEQLKKKQEYYIKRFESTVDFYRQKSQNYVKHLLGYYLKLIVILFIAIVMLAFGIIGLLIDVLICILIARLIKKHKTYKKQKKEYKEYLLY